MKNLLKLLLLPIALPLWCFFLVFTFFMLLPISLYDLDEIPWPTLMGWWWDDFVIDGTANILPFVR